MVKYLKIPRSCSHGPGVRAFGLRVGFCLASAKEQRQRTADTTRDEVVSINGRGMQGLSGDVAMAIVENSVGILELEIMRKRYEDSPLLTIQAVLIVIQRYSPLSRLTNSLKSISLHSRPTNSRTRITNLIKTRTLSRTNPRKHTRTNPIRHTHQVNHRHISHIRVPGSSSLSDIP
ncbi:hypothetical protein BSL78_03607 [Apostichopus japonicus]|uniref:PDZ domain-containing protein n=1 Tax=Stichopus japonicus TaxID=307972 RepID=A0A2G8LGT7_STIJA|nr:hypothetical protein BSL78_03607 [Apostichopus japonicus]